MFHKFVFAVLLVAVLALAVAAPVLADDGVTRACTVKDNWWTKIWSPCVELAEKPSVVTPLPFDKARWELELDRAEQWLRDHSNGNNDPVDDSNPVKDLAWKWYCGSMEEPQYDYAGNPVCK